MTAPSSKIWDWLIDEVRAGAAEEILPRFRRLSSDMVSAKSAPDDLVTEADRQMEERLHGACARLMPQALFLGEEAVSAGRRLLEDLPQAELAIVCAPVDGTWNFAGLSLLTFASRKALPADACLR
ncbi:inositol monophosphatase family protein [Pannonibacter sp. I15F10I1]|uniref:inositol monophosphatase family protein n=1 Tax=Pannonibacter sp. I15F10I1 TaxID=2003580 RepID=UPI001FCBD683|nr:inositol monophosphatase family protein [Pannonibacter sp. I15F10I1]